MKKSIVSFVIAAALVIGGVTVYASASGEAQRAAETEAVEKAKAEKEVAELKAELASIQRKTEAAEAAEEEKKAEEEAAAKKKAEEEAAAKKKAEEEKVAIRKIRRDVNEAFKKLSKQDVSEDEIKELQDKLQKMTDNYIKDMEKLMDEKSKEIMKV